MLTEAVCNGKRTIGFDTLHRPLPPSHVHQGWMTDGDRTSKCVAAGILPLNAVFPIVTHSPILYWRSLIGFVLIFTAATAKLCSKRPMLSELNIGERRSPRPRPLVTAEEPARAKFRVRRTTHRGSPDFYGIAGREQSSRRPRRGCA